MVQGFRLIPKSKFPIIINNSKVDRFTFNMFFNHTWKSNFELPDRFPDDFTANKSQKNHHLSGCFSVTGGSLYRRLPEARVLREGISTPPQGTRCAVWWYHVLDRMGTMNSWLNMRRFFKYWPLMKLLWYYLCSHIIWTIHKTIYICTIS